MFMILNIAETKANLILACNQVEVLSQRGKNYPFKPINLTNLKETIQKIDTESQLENFLKSNHFSKLLLSIGDVCGNDKVCSIDGNTVVKVNNCSNCALYFCDRLSEQIEAEKDAANRAKIRAAAKLKAKSEAKAKELEGIDNRLWVVATIKDANSNCIGYVLLHEPSSKVESFDMVSAAEILKERGCINAEVVGNNNLHGKRYSLSSLPVMYTNDCHIEDGYNDKQLLILRKIAINNETAYKVYDCIWGICYVSEAELLVSAKNRGLANAEIVSKDGYTHIYIK
jgi:hypothetical protein